MALIRAREERLRAYLDGLVGAPVVWADDGSDCCSFAARWVEIETGTRPQLPRYRGEAEARALMAGTALADLWRGVMAVAGHRECLAPALGDVGVIELRSAHVGCIWLHGGFAAVRAADRWTPIAPRLSVISFSVPLGS